MFHILVEKDNINTLPPFAVSFSLSLSLSLFLCLSVLLHSKAWWNGKCAARRNALRVHAYVLISDREARNVVEDDIVKEETRPWIRDIHKNDARGVAVVHLYISQRDVAHRYLGVGGARGIPERVDEAAARPRCIPGLVLLPRPYPNRPPDGIIDGDVLICDVGDEARRILSKLFGVGLDVDSLKGACEGDIPHDHIGDAVVAHIRGDAAHAHTHAPRNGVVMDVVVARTAELRLGTYRIIEIRHTAVTDDDVDARDINPVRIQGINYGDGGREAPSWLPPGRCLYLWWGETSPPSLLHTSEEGR